MFRPAAKFCLISFCVLASFVACAETPSASHSPDPRSPASWVIEQMPGGEVLITNEALTIRDKHGCTVWWRAKLSAPVTIRYKAKVLSSSRVSDLNCFWMATDPQQPEELFHKTHTRTGAFASYDGLRTYYVGYGGNNNTTTRFRRYDGTGKRPLLPEHDLQAKKFLLIPDHSYTIQIEVRSDGTSVYSRDGVAVFRFTDPEPLRSGWFGFRTVDATIVITDFLIEKPTSL